MNSQKRNWSILLGLIILRIGNIEESKLLEDTSIDSPCIFPIEFMATKDFNTFFLWLLLKMKIMKTKKEFLSIKVGFLMREKTYPTEEALRILLTNKA